MEYRRIEVKPLSGACGAEISGVDLSEDLGNETFAEVQRAFHENLVIFFRDQDLTHLEKPPLGSILYALDVPPVGGDTLFANQYLAYEALSDGMKDLLEGLVAVHDNRIQAPSIAADRNAQFTSKVRDDPDEADEPEMEHPVVRTHPDTGKKALFPRTHRFKGMTEAESKPLLEFLFAHSHRPEFTCRFRWEKGSLTFWDNRCLMHKELNDYPGHKRYMNRVTVNGTRPV